MAHIEPAELWAEECADEARVFWLYCIVEDGCDVSGPCKVGIASHITKRLSALQGGNHRRLTFAWLIKLLDRDKAKDAEQSCLMHFRPSPYGGRTLPPKLESEWVAASPQAVLSHAVTRLNVEHEAVRRVS